jgi:hypothetical protein
MNNAVELPDGWMLSIEPTDDGRYRATVTDGRGKGLRVTAQTAPESVADLSTALGQNDRVGRAVRVYVLGGEGLMRHAIAEGESVGEAGTSMPAPRTAATLKPPPPAREPKPDPELDWVPVRSASVRLGVSETTVRRRAKTGAIASRTDQAEGLLIGFEPRHEDQIEHGRILFTVFNPLTSAVAYAVVGEVWSQPQMGALAAVVIFAIFVIGVAYSFGSATRGRLR